ncbi:hypothetical protein [Actinopolymorpha rutila]|uniref:Uncharacterized protein n=1 Tax=Actinopolymorpha rutila TaxID=446787 RepID=A0A852ZVB6_9ACTN|nr:hypothetical protein [Actinopolymorpha rutila]NYH92910.1 hypothetical protein [Actinopolymorpha rutila]
MGTGEATASWMDDAIGLRLRAFGEQLERELGSAATVRRRWVEDAGMVTDLIPVRADALPATWIDFGSGLQLEAGQGPGGFWEIDERDDQAVEFIESTVRAVVAGRVSEVFGPSRSRVEVIYADGSTTHETGYEGPRGCVPVPGWRRQSHKVTYRPYR